MDPLILLLNLLLSFFMAVGLVKLLGFFSEDPQTLFVGDNPSPEPIKPVNVGHKLTVGEGVLIVIFMIFFSGILYFGFKLSMARYQLTSDAIKRGDTGIAMASLAPEIGSGISDLIRGPGR